MPEYLAKYTTRAAMFDGGAWMPDQEPHYDEYRFEAENDEKAQKVADGHKAVIARNYFGPNITLDSLDKVKEIVQEITTPAPQRIHFQKDIGQLVIESGITYQGKRLSTISARSASSHPYKKRAENDALAGLVTLVEKEGADAYEVIGSSIEDSRQEYDGTPYTATVTAILYKSETAPEEQMALFEKK